MTALSAPTLQSVPAKLRPLSGFERLFWAVDKINGFNFGIAVSFRGTIAHARWKAAFAQVQKRHQFLDAAINDDDPQAPSFTRGAGHPIPLVFQRRTSPTDWQRVMESEVAEPFPLSTGPLLRVVVLEDGRGCDLVIMAHHAIIDGMGVLGVVRDLLAALSGQALAELPVPPSSEDRVAQIRAKQIRAKLPAAENEAVPAAEPQPRNRAFVSPNRKGRCAISAIRFSPDESAALLRFARGEQTTIGAVLLAAVAAEVRELSSGLKEADLRVTTAVDARPYLGNEDDFVLSVISPRAIVSYPDGNLAASARAIKAQIAPLQSFENIEATFARVGAVVSQQLDAAAIVNLLIPIAGCDVLVSNLRIVQFAATCDGLVVESVWGPSVLLGGEGEHAVGSATFGGALHLVYSSFTPLPGLLEAVRERILSACGAN